MTDRTLNCSVAQSVLNATLSRTGWSQRFTFQYKKSVIWKQRNSHNLFQQTHPKPEKDNNVWIHTSNELLYTKKYFIQTHMEGDDNQKLNILPIVFKFQSPMTLRHTWVMSQVWKQWCNN